MTVSEIRLAGETDLRARLAQISKSTPTSWKDMDAAEREASSIRMELLARERQASGAPALNAVS